ncbi:MAG: RNA-binding protein [Opitutales bacterium]|nr:RNA-binding protein [Opitutales bacterium]NRA27385.1 RNA-binding protein [Opitutales bacterium]
MNIYIGNLSYAATDQDLEELFSPYGEVSKTTIIMDRETGRSKGFGFAEMPDDDAAKTAIDALNGSTFLNRNITVNEARPREERPRGGGGYRGGGYRGGDRRGGGGFRGGDRRGGPSGGGGGGRKDRRFDRGGDSWD